MTAREDFFKLLRNSFASPLPGPDIQYKMASAFRKSEIPDIDSVSNFKESAVCVLIYEREEKLMFPLIERMVYQGVHSGQIAFPGGKRDAADNNLQETALRELFEETGIQIGSEQVVGKLSRLYIPPSNFMVYPFVAVTEQEPVFRPDSREVQQILEVPFEEFLDESIVKETVLEVNGYKIKTPYFDIRGKIVWGATAMILNELKHIIVSFQSL